MKHTFQLISLILLVCFYACNNDKQTPPKDIKVETEVEINKLISQEPNNAHLYFTRANMFINKGEYIPAINDLKKASDLDKNNIEYTHLLADTYFDNEQYDFAINTLNRYITDHPKASNTRLKLSEFFLILKKHEESKQVLDDLLKSEPQNAEAHFMQGLNYQDQLKNQEAIDAFMTAVENNPDLVEAWIILGNLHEKIDTKKAITFFDNAINIDPNNPKPYHSKAFLLQNTDRIPEALEIYKQLNVKHPDYIPSFLNTGILYMELDNTPLAIEHFNVIVQQYPQNPVGYHYLALAEAKAGNTEKAIQLANDALQLDPDYKEAEEFIKSLSK